MSNGIRYHRFKHDEIYELLKQKGSLYTELQDLQSKVDALAKEGDVVAQKYQKVKDKAIPLIQEIVDGVELGEFEVFGTFDIEGDEVVGQIIDLLEEEKARIKERKEKEKQEKIK